MVLNSGSGGGATNSGGGGGGGVNSTNSIGGGGSGGGTGVLPSIGTNFFLCCDIFLIIDFLFTVPVKPHSSVQYYPTYKYGFHAIAGFIASFLTVVVLHPLDVLRTTEITHSRSFATTINVVLHSYSPTNCLMKFCNLYRAFPISLFVFVLNYTLYFPFNVYLKNNLPFEFPRPIILDVICHMITTLTLVTILHPLWTIKTLQITRHPKTDTQPKHSARTVMRAIYEQNGYLGFFKGLGLGYLTCIDEIISFTLYDALKRSFIITARHTIVDYMLCVLISKTMSIIFTYPFTVLHLKGHVRLLHSKERRIRNFYGGFISTLLHHVIRNIMLLVIYEELIILFKTL
jgi:predicted acyltransferase